MSVDDADEYFELSARFRELVAEHEPGMTGREPLMRYPGEGNRQERRAMKARAMRTRNARASKRA